MTAAAATGLPRVSASQDEALTRARIARDLRVFRFLQRHGQEHGRSFVLRTRDVAHALDIKERSALKGLKNLERAGLLETGEQVYDRRGQGQGAPRWLIGPKWKL